MSGDDRDLHSFPTRRSSDLAAGRARRPQPAAVPAAGTSAAAIRSRAASGVGASSTRSAAPRSANASSMTRSIAARRSEEHTSELQSHVNLVCRLLLEKKNMLYALTGFTRVLAAHSFEKYITLLVAATASARTPIIFAYFLGFAL